MAELQCEHCKDVHSDADQLCPKTGKIFRPERIFPPGQVLDGKYRLEEVLGSGGMGAVFKATHVMMGKTLAVKLMLPSQSQDKELVGRMMREAQLASKTGHRNVITVTDMGKTEDGALYIVMEYLEGRTLRQLLREEKRLPILRAAEIVSQILAGLHAVHVHEIVHRDLKPDNVILIKELDGDECAKILDFGISKSYTDDEALELTRAGTVVGSPLFMSPEQASGSSVDHRADLYACGAVFYALITGRPPLLAANYNAMIAEILTGTIKPPSTIVPEIGEGADAIVLRALARDPAARYQDAKSFQRALAELISGTSATDSLDTSSVESTKISLDNRELLNVTRGSGAMPTATLGSGRRPLTDGPAAQSILAATRGSGGHMMDVTRATDEPALLAVSGEKSAAGLLATSAQISAEEVAQKDELLASLDALNSAGLVALDERGESETDDAVPPDPPADVSSGAPASRPANPSTIGPTPNAGVYKLAGDGARNESTSGSPAPSSVPATPVAPVAENNQADRFAPPAEREEALELADPDDWQTGGSLGWSGSSKKSAKQKASKPRYVKPVRAGTDPGRSRVGHLSGTSRHSARRKGGSGPLIAMVIVVVAAGIAAFVLRDRLVSLFASEKTESRPVTNGEATVDITHVLVTVSAFPPDAKIFIKGELQEYNPMQMEFGKEPVKIEVRAKGYVTETVSVVPDENRDVFVRLKVAKKKAASKAKGRSRRARERRRSK